MSLRPIVNLQIVGGFELSLAAFTGNRFDVSTQESNATGVAFNPDGTRMFIIGTNSESVHQYSLSTGFDIDTASFTGTSFDVSGQDTAPDGVTFSSDGTRMFIVADTSLRVHQYSLTTGFDISTASFSGTSFDTSPQETLPTGVAFNSDGTRMFIIGQSSNSVHQYSLTTGFDISTASFSGISFDVSGQAGEPESVTFNPDGTRMFIIGSNSDSVHQYSLRTGFDIDTASFTGTSFDVLAETGRGKDVTFNPDGTRMFIIGSIFNSVLLCSLEKLISQE